jgi:hypothetical protein
VNDHESAAEALVRELEEELGVKVELPTVAPSRRIDGPEFELLVWVLDAWSGEVSNHDPSEHASVAWFDVDALRKQTLAHPPGRRAGPPSLLVPDPAGFQGPPLGGSGPRGNLETALRCPGSTAWSGRRDAVPLFPPYLDTSHAVPSLSASRLLFARYPRRLTFGLYVADDHAMPVRLHLTDAVQDDDFVADAKP